VVDIDTSNHRDPSPTAAELLSIRDRMLARLDGGAPVRVIRSVVRDTATWHDDVRLMTWRSSNRSIRRRPARYAGATHRSRQLAATGTHLGLDQVGLILEDR